MTRCLVISGGSAAAGPYGIDELGHLGYELVEVAPARSRIHRKIRDVVEHRSGIHMDKTIRSVRLAGTTDLTLAFLEPFAIAPAWLKRNGLTPLARKPLAMIACWLADDLRRCGSSEARRALAGRYRGVDLTIVFSANQVDVLVESGFAPDSLAVVPFGFAPGLFPRVPFETRDSRVAAVGFDRGRDYATLIEAVTGTDIQVDLYCRSANIEGLVLPTNVHFHGTVPFDEYRRILASTGVVAAPTHPMEYPSGQTVALESAATGACVIVSDTPALREYFTPDVARLVQPGDVAAWRRALLDVTGDATLRGRLGDAAAEHVASSFTYAQMWSKIDSLVAARGWKR